MTREKPQPEDGVHLVLTDHGAAFRPKSFARLHPDAQAVVIDLEHRRAHLAVVEQSIRETVAEARDLGVSWFHIGVSLGTTGDAARRRFVFEQED